MSAVLLPNQLSNGRLQVRFAYGADLAVDPTTWTYTDVTADVMQANGGGVTISPMGRSNESSVAQPAGCSFRLKNPTGAYTPYNPSSANYPNIRLGTPVQVRVSLDGGSNYSVRFQGEASSWTPGWDAQGKLAYVAFTASGMTRRLGAGSKPLNSAVRRAISADSPVEYWSLEDASTSGIGASVVGNRPLVVSAVPVTFAGDAVSPPPGSLPLPDFSAGGELSCNSLATISSTGYAVSFLVRTSTAISTTPIRWLIGSGTYDRTRVDIAPASIQLILFSSVTSVGILSASTDLTDGEYHFVRVILTQSGGNILGELWVDGVQVDTGSDASTLGAPSVVILNPQGYSAATGNVFSVGHVAIFSGAGSNSPALAVSGYAGETADDRITRLCAEEGIRLTITGGSDTAMGPQGVDTLMNLLRECEAADLGYLLDGLGPGLTYVCRSSLYNEAAQVTVNANSGQVPASPGPQPTHDDQRIINRVTVTRTNGSFKVAEDSSGTLGTAAVGVRDTRSVVNTQTDNQLQDIAAWLVHVGTVEGMRYPQILLDLTAAPELAATWVGTVPTDRVDVTNLSNRLTQHPTGDVSLLAEGWTEFISSRSWRVTVNCSPFRSWEVFSVADTRLGRIETSGSTLHQNYSTGATSLLVDVNTLPLWTTGSVSFDVEIRGWQIHVTNISGSSSPQTFTVTATLGDLGGGNPVKLWKPGVIAL